MDWRDIMTGGTHRECSRLVFHQGQKCTCGKTGKCIGDIDEQCTAKGEGDGQEATQSDDN